ERALGPLVERERGPRRLRGARLGYLGADVVGRRLGDGRERAEGGGIARAGSGSGGRGHGLGHGRAAYARRRRAEKGHRARRKRGIAASAERLHSTASAVAMRIHVLSDLHLEFEPHHLLPEAAEPTGPLLLYGDLPTTDADVVVLAGDIALGGDGVA